MASVSYNAVALINLTSGVHPVRVAPTALPAWAEKVYCVKPHAAVAELRPDAYGMLDVWHYAALGAEPDLLLCVSRGVTSAVPTYRVEYRVVQELIEACCKRLDDLEANWRTTIMPIAICSAILAEAKVVPLREKPWGPVAVASPVLGPDRKHCAYLHFRSLPWD